MVHAEGGLVLREWQALLGLGAAGALTDGQLLERFVAARNELAFAALMDRHGAIVLRACGSALRDPNDVEDAFQATFLLLVRKAATIRRRDSVGSWLFGAALRVAACARTRARRRRESERRAAARAGEVDRRRGFGPDEAEAILHEEIARLPEKYRDPVVLCYLEGLTHEQAAARLRWPVGTVHTRLARARASLRARLARRGLATETAVPGAAQSPAGAAVPAALTEATIRAALAMASGRAVTCSAVAAVRAASARSISPALVALAVVPIGLAALALRPSGPPAPTPGAEAEAASLLAKSDTGGDGRLNADEVPVRLRPEFPRIDADHDGYVDLAELARALRPAPRRGRVLTRYLITVADDFVVEVYHNGRRVPDSHRPS